MGPRCGFPFSNVPHTHTQKSGLIFKYIEEEDSKPSMPISRHEQHSKPKKAKDLGIVVDGHPSEEEVAQERRQVLLAGLSLPAEAAALAGQQAAAERLQMLLVRRVRQQLRQLGQGAAHAAPHRVLVLPC